MSVKIEQTKSEKLKREYTVTVSAKQIDETVNQKIATLQKTIKMPGFRPGKVPLDMIKKTHGRNVMGEVLERSVQQGSQEVFKKENISPAAQPKIEVKSFDEGKDLVFEMKAEILPEVPAIDLKSITLTDYEIKVNDADIDDALERIREQHTGFAPIKGDRKAKKGDRAVIDYLGKNDGVPFDGGKAEGHPLELGSGSFIPGFEEQVIGLKKGDEKVISVTFPKEYHSEDLAGKEVTFDVKVNDIEESTTFDKADEAFAESLGFKELETLKDAVKDQLTRESADASKALKKKELFDALEDAATFDVPEQMMDSEFDAIWKQYEDSKTRGVQDPDLEGKSEKEIKNIYEEMAARRVRLGIMLTDVAKKEKVNITQEDLQRSALQYAMQFRGQEQQMLEMIQKSPEMLENFRGPLLEEKATDILFGKVKTDTKKLSLGEFRDIQEAGANDAKAKKAGTKAKSTAKKPAETKNKTTAKSSDTSDKSKKAKSEKKAS